MTWVDMLWIPPLMLAIACVVGAAGQPKGEVRPAIKSAFWTLSFAVVVVGLIVHLTVVFFG